MPRQPRPASEPPSPGHAPPLGLLEGLPDAVTLHAPDGRVVAANPAAAALCGIPREALVGVRPGRLAAPGWRGRRRAAAAFREAAAGRPSRTGFEGRAADGSAFRVEASLSPATVEGRRLVVAISRGTSPGPTDERDLHEECEQRLAALLDNAPDVVDIVGADGVVRYVSPAVERILGWRPDEVVGHSSLELLDPEQVPEIVASLARVAANPGGRNPPVELRMRHRDGGWRLLQAQSTNLLHHPAVRGIVVNARDITDERAAAEALARSEARYRSVVESMGEALLITDAEGVVTYANGRIRDVLGLSPGEVVGRAVHDAVGWGVPRDEVERRLRERLRGIPERYEAPMLRADGARIWVDVVGAPLRDAEGKVVGSLATFSDATERRMWQEELGDLVSRELDARERLQHLVESISDAFFAVDREWRFTYVNARAEREWGRARSELLGRVLWEEFPQLLGTPWESAYREAMGQARDVRLEEFIPAQGRWWEARAYAWRDGLSVFSADTTERRRAVEALRESETARREGERLLRSVLDGIEDLIFLLDADGRLVLANGACFRALGCTPEEALGRDVHARAGPAAAARLRAMDRRVMATGEPLSSEDVVSTPDGVRTFLTSRVAWHTPGGRAAGVLAVARDITQMKRVEDALREREQVLQAVLEGIADPVFLKDAGGRFVLANHATLAVLGRTAEEVLGRTEAELLGEEVARRRRATDARVMESGEPVTYEETLASAVGHRTFLTTKVPWRAPDGSVAGVVGLARDVTDLKAAEQALRESEERLALVLTSTSDGLWDWNVATGDVFFGPQWAEMLGYRADELEPSVQTWERLVHPDDLPRARERLSAHFADRVPHYETEHRLRTQDGRWKWVLARGKLVERAADGTPARMVGTHVDIDDRKRIEAELAASEHEYRDLFDNAHDPILILDPDERVLEVNARACEVYGIPRERFVGMDMVELSDDPGAGRRHARATLAGQGLYEFETVQRRGDGSPLVLEVRARPMTYAGSPAILSVNRDISGRRALEEQLRQAQKIEAVGRLAGGIAHDFNNVLMAVAGHAKLLLRRTAEDDPGRWSLEEIRRGTDRAAGLTRQLLAFSRQQILQPRVLELAGVVTGVTPMLERLIGEDVELVHALDPAAGRVRADPGQLEQVIVNLALNSRDAMPHGGVLHIATRPAELGEDDPRRSAYVPPGRYVELEVRDSGQGMDPETMAHVFEPFFTTKEPGRGTGLGLAMVYGIVKQSGGYIGVESAPGAGTRFTIFLPRVDEPASPALPAAAGAPPRRGTETILLAEDDPGVRRLAATVLSGSGYTVLEAKDGGEALRRVEAHAGPIHLLLADMVMPGMRTAELVARLRAMRPRLRVMAMSGYSEEALSAGGRGEVGGELVQKPVDPDTLLRKVRELLDQDLEGAYP